MDDIARPDDKTRKTITMTHRQAGFTFGGIVSTFTLLHFLNGYYFPQEEAKVLKVEVREIAKGQDELKQIVKDGFANQTSVLAAHTIDETHKHERIVDNLRKEMADEKADRIRDDEGVSKRIDIVMELFRIKHSKTN